VNPGNRQNLLRQQLHQELGGRLVGPQGRAEHMRSLGVEAQVLATGGIRAQGRGQGLAHYVSPAVVLNRGYLLLVSWSIGIYELIVRLIYL